MKSTISILVFSIFTPLVECFSTSRLLLTTTIRSTARHAATGAPLPIDSVFPGLQKVHSDPDIYILHDFLSPTACQDIIQQAKGDMTQSPTAYAGYTQDTKNLIQLAAKGPVVWLALVTAWYQTQQEQQGQVILLLHALQNYLLFFAAALAAVAAYTQSRAKGLQALRTSTSTTLEDLSNAGVKLFVQQAARLFSPSSSSLKQQARYFEAPTVIRYEPGQLLAPHYDANPAAAAEDANRGGQTLATLLVYLNNVPQGGATRFGKLDLSVQPAMGDALLFFPADANGCFDERMEHEGCPAVDEKWIARIWRHEARSPPPFGLSEKMLALL